MKLLTVRQGRLGGKIIVRRMSPEDLKGYIVISDISLDDVIMPTSPSPDLLLGDPGATNDNLLLLHTTENIVDSPGDSCS